MDENYILRMKGITKSFSGVTVLDNVDFDLKKGEVHALLGENGAGKSTMMKILGGIYKPDSGELVLNGKTVVMSNPLVARSLGISFIHQEISLVEELTIAQNMFLGDEPRKGKIFVDNKTIKKRAQKMLDELKLNLDADQKIGTLSVAQQQMVEIAKAVSFNAQIVIMDEPTAALTPSEVESLFKQIDILKEKNVSIIYISHRLEEIAVVADRLTVLRDGKYIGTRPASISQEEIIQMMVGRELSDMYAQNEKIGSDETIFEVKHFRNRRLKDVSIDLKRGEILGIAGLVGAGRTELARAIYGIDRIDAGEMLLNGEKIRIQRPSQALDHGIALVPEDRKGQGLVLMKGVDYNITLPVIKSFIKGVRVNKKKEQEIIDNYAHRLSIKMSSPKQLCASLSGGNQQKVVISKWLAANANIMIFDEPTRGIDVGAKSEIYHLIMELAKMGISIIMISSELPEILNLSTRIVVMCEGKVTGILDNKEKSVTQEEVMRYAIGG